LGHENVDWFHLVMDRIQKLADVEYSNEYLLSVNHGSFMTICNLTSFSRRHLRHEDSHLFLSNISNNSRYKVFYTLWEWPITLMTMRNFSLNVSPHHLVSSCWHFKSACGKHLQILSNTRTVYSPTCIVNKEAGNSNETSVTTWEFRLSSLRSWGLRSSGMFATLVGHYYWRLATTCLPRLHATDI